MPTATASHSARHRCASSRDPSPEIHFESPVRVATFPSSVMADLNSTCGRPVRACLRNGWLSSRAVVAVSPSATRISTPSSRRMPSPRPDAFSVGSSSRRRRGGCPPPGSPPCTAGLPVVAAGLQRHVQRRAARVRRAARGERCALGVRLAETGVEALADDRPVLDHDGATRGFGLTWPRPPPASAIARSRKRGRWRGAWSRSSPVYVGDEAGRGGSPGAGGAGDRSGPRCTVQGPR
jgi:hypothetical protein